jgi:signal transduction histidine kinase
MKALFRRAGLNSIQGRLTAITFFFIFATAVTMGVAGYQLTLAFESKRFHEHFGLLASYLASNAELGVLLGNEKYLEGLTENMLAVSDVQSVEVLDKHDRVIMRRAHENLETELASVSAPVVARSMGATDSPFLEGNESEEVLGRVTMSYSLTGLAQLREQLALRFVIVSLLLATVSVAMYWKLSKAINAPLKELLKVARQVSLGQTDVRAKGGSLREINTLSGAINDMLDGLESHRRELDQANAVMARQQVFAEVGKFSMTVAHEIKNPLAIIKGSLGILKKNGPVDPELKTRMIGFIDGEIERINRLIEDFLQFARPHPPALQKVPVGDLVDSLVQRITLMDANVHIDRGHPGEEAGIELLCDPFLLERALLNIVRNALEATTHQDAVRFGVVCADDGLVFNVQDDGPGIDAEALPRIFEPFFSTKSKGTGLGLAIARNVVDAHGGRLSATNLSSGGACFTLSLPVVSVGTQRV